MKRDDFLNAVASQGGPEMDSDNRLNVASAHNEVHADLAMLIPAADEVRYGVQIGKGLTKSRDGKLEVGTCMWLLVLLADLVELRVDSLAADGCTAVPETVKILSHKTPLAGAAQITTTTTHEGRQQVRRELSVSREGKCIVTLSSSDLVVDDTPPYVPAKQVAVLGRFLAALVEASAAARTLPPPATARKG